MITKELVKAEVEKVKDDYLEVLYKIIKIFATPLEIGIPLSRGEQGSYEVREAMP